MRELNDCRTSCASRYDPHAELGILIDRARHALLVGVDATLGLDESVAPLQLTAAQGVILANLAAQNEPTPIAHLCRRISYDTGAMTHMLDRLEAKGLIQRRPCRVDRRVVYLDLTESGQAMVPRIRAAFVAVQKQLFDGFAPEDVCQLKALLTRMLENGAAER